MYCCVYKLPGSAIQTPITAGRSPVYPLPLTLGHEVAGIVAETGGLVRRFRPGDRAVLHYMVTCGSCDACNRGNEQFCTTGSMIGKYRDGGYAEYICVPERSVFALPAEVPFEQGAVLMCSSATAFHALRKARLQPGERVAVFGLGGLGMSAVQLARVLGAEEVYAVDLVPGKLAAAGRFGAIPVDAGKADPVETIRSLTGGKGVDVSLELIGLPLTIRQALQSLAIQGRAAIAGITEQTVEFAPYADLINREAEIIGVSDHLAQELPRLLAWAHSGKLNLSEVVTQTIPLEGGAINAVLDQLEGSTETVRVVINP